ncbi:hypothetical protein Tco_0831846 [Tanacetum coccineum]
MSGSLYSPITGQYCSIVFHIPVLPVMWGRSLLDSKNTISLDECGSSSAAAPEVSAPAEVEPENVVPEDTYLDLTGPDEVVATQSGKSKRKRLGEQSDTLLAKQLRKDHPSLATLCPNRRMSAVYTAAELWLLVTSVRGEYGRYAYVGCSRERRRAERAKEGVEGGHAEKDTDISSLDIPRTDISQFALDDFQGRHVLKSPGA